MQFENVKNDLSAIIGEVSSLIILCRFVSHLHGVNWRYNLPCFLIFPAVVRA